MVGSGRSHGTRDRWAPESVQAERDHPGLCQRRVRVAGRVRLVCRRGKETSGSLDSVPSLVRHGSRSGSGLGFGCGLGWAPDGAPFVLAAAAAGAAAGAAEGAANSLRGVAETIESSAPLNGVVMSSNHENIEPAFAEKMPPNPPDAAPPAAICFCITTRNCTRTRMRAHTLLSHWRGSRRARPEAQGAEG